MKPEAPVRVDLATLFAPPDKALTVLMALLLAVSSLGAEDTPRIVEGAARELAKVRSIFVVSNDEASRGSFSTALEKSLPEVTIAERAEDADAIVVLTSSLVREVVQIPDSGGCAPCQAQVGPQRLDLESRKVVLSVLVPTGPDEYRRILFANASGGFGSNPEERVAIQFRKAWKKWAAKR
jgi:hypothetical protein